jgi:murein DD-endopeptidase MepM/ murein hydrolase activator NlpD
LIFRWQGWDKELTPRARGLLIGAGLLGVAAVSTSHRPQREASSPPLTMTARVIETGSRVRDSIANTRGQDTNIGELPSTVYRRSSQVLQAEQELRDRNLLLPLPDLTNGQLRDNFDEPRDQGARRHNAIDIPAAKGTPIFAVDSGYVVKLHTSRDGGISVYATDPSSRYIYFYAHLDSYHPLLVEGVTLIPGDTIGYVGTTGNASPDQPHLHLAILRASSLGGWSRGTPINPVNIWRKP